MDHHENRKRGHYRSLSRNMLLNILFVSITPLLLVSGIILYQFNISYQEKIEAHLGELVLKHKQNIDSFLTQKLSEISFTATCSGFEILSQKKNLQAQLTTLQREYGTVFEDLGVIDSQGVQIAYAGPFSLGKAHYSEADWFYNVMESGAFISDVFLGLRGLPHFIVAVREDWNGEPWILRATIDFAAFNDLVENIRIGETGFAFILNNNGEFQTSSRLESEAKEWIYKEFLQAEEKPYDKVMISRAAGEDGKKNIYVAAFLKGRDWLLVYQQATLDAFADFNKTFKIAFIVILIGSVGIITMSFLLSGRTIKRLSKMDYEKDLMDKQIVEAGKLASIGELAAGIAHEINNPVAIIVEEAGWIEDLLGDDDPCSRDNLKEFERAINQIKVQGRRCKDITHKLLSFTRKTDTGIQKVQINDILKELISLSEQRARYRNVRIEAIFKKDLVEVTVSQSEMQQVFLNLINNALDAMEPKGGLLKVATYYEKGEVVVKIYDNGHGIPEANQSKLFDPFFTTKPMGKGTGLGLSICYGIIKKIGGHIDVESEVNVGTTFRVKLPVGDK
ncbi:MAG: two-component sensor histidine kinase [Deltaproteobacteria bacterium]|nr:two-component sensor histidine kinase [Deltaproteobacteria bacterium]